MSIRIQCAKCGNAYSLKTELAGKKVKCKCGHAMLVPAVARAPAAVASRPLAAKHTAADPAAAGSELPSSDEPLLPGLDSIPEFDDLADVAREAATLPTLAATRTSDAAGRSKSSKRSERDSQKLIQVAMIAATGIFIAGVAVAIFVVASRARQPGYASPEKALAAYQSALGADKWKDLYCTLDDPSGESMLRTMVAEVLPLAEKREEIKAVLQKHCGEVPVVTAPDIDSPTFESGDFEKFRVQVQEHSLSLVTAAASKPDFYNELVVAIRDAEERFMPHNAVLKVIAKKPSNTLRRELAQLPRPALPVEGDTARGAFSIVIEGSEFEGQFVFKKTGDRWFLHIADPLEFAGGLVGYTFAAGGVFYPRLY